ncbi:hypothetical protein Tco_1480079, partial [Tanacetum coccineum]
SKQHICFPNNTAYSVNSIQRIGIQQTYTAYSDPLNTAYLLSDTCITRSSTKEILSPFENMEQKFRSKRRLFDTPSLIESNLLEFDHIFDIREQSEEGERETMTETMEQYMSTEKITELRDNTFSGSEHEDANEHIEKVLEIVDLFSLPKVTQDQIMLRAFSVCLTEAASRWLKNQPSGSITTWEGAIPSKTVADVKIAIQEMAKYSQKWHNGTSLRTRSTETSDGSVHPIKLEDNIEQQGQDSTNETMETLRTLIEDQAWIESLTKFMAESAKRHEENSNIIKEIRASTDAAIRNQGA